MNIHMQNGLDMDRVGQEFTNPTQTSPGSKTLHMDDLRRPVSTQQI